MFDSLKAIINNKFICKLSLHIHNLFSAVDQILQSLSVLAQEQDTMQDDREREMQRQQLHQESKIVENQVCMTITYYFNDIYIFIQ